LGMVVSFANQKGGVGKTTLAINLGSALALSDIKVLIVDFDPQGHVTVGLDIQHEGKTIYKVISDEIKIEEAIFHTKVENLFVVPADENLAGFEVEFFNNENSQFILKDKLKDIREKFDFIFIDCPPSIGVFTISALCASDYVIIPVLPDFFSLEGFSKFFKAIEEVRANLNPSLEILGIVINMYDKRAKLTKEVEEEFMKYFPGKIFRTRIVKSVKIAEAPGFGLPVVLYKPSSPASDVFAYLAEEFLEKISEERKKKAQISS
jgi:chromosome partitioning protein